MEKLLKLKQKLMERLKVLLARQNSEYEEIRGYYDGQESELLTVIDKIDEIEKGG